MESIIKVDKVTKKFGSDIALNNVSIEFERGKIYGIVGRNGSGKTVLFKTIIGFLKPTFPSMAYPGIAFAMRDKWAIPSCCNKYPEICIPNTINIP